MNRGTMGVNSLPKTASQLRFEPGFSAPESSALTTRLPSHPSWGVYSLVLPETSASEWVGREVGVGDDVTDQRTCRTFLDDRVAQVDLQ